jgi:hypothetical protein
LCHDGEIEKVVIGREYDLGLGKFPPFFGLREEIYKNAE